MPDTKYKNVTVYIASATKDHLTDLKHCLNFNPNRIFIEKGFVNEDEKNQAQEILRQKKIKAYILSQYRYSKVFTYIKLLGEKYKSISYNWTIDKGDISEWMYHIVSIDNYLKNTKKSLYTNEQGIHILDDISVVNIQQVNNYRSLYIDIETDKSIFKLSLGKNNMIHVITKDGKYIATQTCVNEDCLESQIESTILGSHNNYLERL